jgi:hypothetical protein
MLGFLRLQHGDILSKEVFKLFICQHFINQLENGLFVIIIKLLYEPHLFYCCFVFARAGVPAKSPMRGVITSIS